MALLLAVFIATPQIARAQSADSYIVIDANTGRVLNALNPDAQLFPASMTKIMTLYLTFEALSQGRLSLNTYLPVSELAAGQSPSKLGLRAGSSVSVQNCIYAAVTLSANDCAVVLAEGIGGSEDEFARMMTSRAHSLGMTQTHFNNANGLPDDGQLTTARDMAVLAEAMIQRFPRFYPVFSSRAFTYNGITHANHNHLMSRYPGMDGIKTGFIRASGFNLTASAVQRGRRLIAVVFGGRSAVARDNFMASLLDDGFRRVAGERVQPAFVAPGQLVAEAPGVAPQIVLREAAAHAPSIAETARTGPAEAGDEVEPNEGSAQTAPPAPAAATPTPAGAIEAAQVAGMVRPEAPAPSPAPAPQPVATTPAIAPTVLTTPQPLPPALAPSALAPSALAPSALAPTQPLEVDQRQLASVDEAAPRSAFQPAAALRHVFTAPKATHKSYWGVQIGTFASRAFADTVLDKSIAALPVSIRDDAKPVAVRMKVRNKTVYRAELTGFDELGAKKACSVLAHCLTIRS